MDKNPNLLELVRQTLDCFSLNDKKSLKSAERCQHKMNQALFVLSSKPVSFCNRKSSLCLTQMPKMRRECRICWRLWFLTPFLSAIYRCEAVFCMVWYRQPLLISTWVWCLSIAPNNGWWICVNKACIAYAAHRHYPKTIKANSVWESKQTNKLLNMK